MKSFQEFKEIVESKVDVEVLAESLDSAVEYYMTDDTNIPDHIYAKFTLGTDDYAVIFSKSNVPNVYLINIGRAPGKYLKLWQIKPNHLRQVLSTTIKVTEAVIPLLGAKAQGYAFRLPKETKRNLIPLLNKLINRSFIKTMKAIPVDNSNVEWPYLFIARKTAEPKQLFKGKDFDKYDFSVKVNPNVAPVVPSGNTGETFTMKAGVSLAKPASVAAPQQVTNSPVLGYKDYELWKNYDPVTVGYSVGHFYSFLKNNPSLHEFLGLFQTHYNMLFDTEKHWYENFKKKAPHEQEDFLQDMKNLFQKTEQKYKAQAEIAASKTPANPDVTYAQWASKYVWDSGILEDRAHWAAARFRYYFATDMEFSHFLNILKKHKFKWSGNMYEFAMAMLGKWSVIVAKSIFMTMKGLKGQVEGSSKTTDMDTSTTSDGPKIEVLQSIPAEALQNELKPVQKIKAVVSDTPSTKYTFSTGAVTDVEIDDHKASLTPEEITSKVYPLKGETPEVKKVEKKPLTINDVKVELSKVHQDPAPNAGPVSVEAVPVYSTNDVLKAKFGKMASWGLYSYEHLALLLYDAVAVKGQTYVIWSSIQKALDAGKIPKPSAFTDDEWEQIIAKNKYLANSGEINKKTIVNAMDTIYQWKTNPNIHFPKPVVTPAPAPLSAKFSEEKAFLSMGNYLGWQAGVTNNIDYKTLYIAGLLVKDIGEAENLSDKAAIVLNWENHITIYQPHEKTKEEVMAKLGAMTTNERLAYLDSLVPLLKKSTETYNELLNAKSKTAGKIGTKEIDLGLEPFSYKFSENDFTNKSEQLLGKSYDNYATKFEDNMKDLRKFYTNTITKLTSEERTAVQSYTGSGYQSINPALRKILKGQAISVNGEGTSVTRALRMQKIFAKSDPLPYDQMVFRTSDVPPYNPEWDINTNLVDSAFLSTTVNSKFDFNSSGSILAITLPKGCKVIITGGDLTGNAHEYEIILPAFSILKPWKIVRGQHRQVIHCVYVGNGMNDLFDKYIKKPTNESFTMPEERGMNDRILVKVLENLKMGADKNKSKFEEPAFSSVEDIEAANLMVKKGDVKISLNDLKKKVKK